MRVVTCLCVVLLGIATGAQAQQSWDIGATVGAASVSPQTPREPYGDDWYFEGRYAVSIGKYWTDHIKTELEFAHSDEGSRYVQQFVDRPGVPPHYSIPAQEYHRLQQLSGRVVYQFLDNAWVHPYVLGGVTLDIDRRRREIPPNYFYPPVTPQNRPSPILVTPGATEGPDTSWRPAATFGAGAKMYMTRRTFFNAAATASLAQTTRTFSLIAGFGLDF